MENHLADYARDGFCVIPEALSLDEVGEINAAIDADLRENRRLWRRGNYPGVRNSLVLLSRPEFDVTMRPPGLVPLMEGIMGADLCADQHEVVIRPPNPDGPSQCEWHRDGTRPMSPPCYTYLLHLVIYLTRVGDDTHCFSVIPGSSQGREFPPIEDYDLDSAVHITGEPGHRNPVQRGDSPRVEFQEDRRGASFRPLLDRAKFTAGDGQPHHLSPPSLPVGGCGNCQVLLPRQ